MPRGTHGLAASVCPVIDGEVVEEALGPAELLHNQPQ